MNPPEIVFAHYDNPRMEQEARDVIDRLLFVFPAWVSYLRVCSTSTNDPNAPLAQVYCHAEYRQMTIEVFADWHEQTEQRRVFTMLHEIVHAMLDPFTGWTKNALVAPIRDRNEELFNSLEAERVYRMESVTQQITYVIAGALGFDPPWPS